MKDGGVIEAVERYAKAVGVAEGKIKEYGVKIDLMLIYAMEAEELKEEMREAEMEKERCRVELTRAILAAEGVAK